MLVEEERPNTSFSGAEISEEFLQGFVSAVGEGGNALFSTMDHLALVDVVGVAGDLLEEFNVLADKRGDRVVCV